MKVSKYWSRYGEELINIETRAEAIAEVMSRLLEETVSSAKHFSQTNDYPFPKAFVHTVENKNRKWNSIIRMFNGVCKDKSMWLKKDDFRKYVSAACHDIYEMAAMMDAVEDVVKESSQSQETENA